MTVPQSRTILALAIVATIASGVAGCGDDSGPGSAGPAPAAAITIQPTTAAASTRTAEKVLADLTAAGLPLTNGVVQDENTDPNNLLGRPNGYVSRASFDVDGGDPTAAPYKVDRGGVIEVFADGAAAQARSKYIQDTLKSLGPMMGTEYHYLSGPVLVRIFGSVKPSVAAKFEAAVGAMKA